MSNDSFALRDSPSPGAAAANPLLDRALCAVASRMPAPVGPNASSATAAIRLVVHGFSTVERRLLESTVNFWQRRTPRLMLLPDTELARADVVMIDALDAAAVDWARSEAGLADKATIWVDGSDVAAGHCVVKRPIQWPILPILLARALDLGNTNRARHDRSAPGSNPNPAANSGAKSRRPVLVVDDSLAVRAHLRSQLEAHGFQVGEADSVPTALEAVSRTAFDYVLMDVLMPGADGYEGCKLIKAKLRGAAKVPVIMLTSKTSPFDRIRGNMAGCDAYLTKPVDTKQLIATLAQHAAQSSNE